MTPQDTIVDPITTPQDGRHDFDFLLGRWRVINQKLAKPLVRDNSDWLEFESTTTVRSILGGLGNIEQVLAPDFPGRPGFEGMTLRLFDPDSRQWRIWWASTARPGVLEIPMVGQFIADHGIFYCDDIVDGVELKVRFDWTVLSDRSARWEQAFSFDQGENWHTNWTWSLNRED
jgi:hypothetical protein